MGQQVVVGRPNVLIPPWAASSSCQSDMTRFSDDIYNEKFPRCSVMMLLLNDPFISITKNEEVQSYRSDSRCFLWWSETLFFECFFLFWRRKAFIFQMLTMFTRALILQ